MIKRNFKTAIAIGLFLGLTAIGPSVAQGPPEPSDYVRQGQPAPLLLDPKACQDGRSTTGSGVTDLPHPEEIVNEQFAIITDVCPPAEINPDLPSLLSGSGHWGHRPN